jgi:hypothetical protein
MARTWKTEFLDRNRKSSMTWRTETVDEGQADQRIDRRNEGPRTGRTGFIEIASSAIVKHACPPFFWKLEVVIIQILNEVRKNGCR